MKDDKTQLVCRFTITTESGTNGEDDEYPWEIVIIDRPLAYLPPQGFKYFHPVLEKELEVLGEYYADFEEPNLVTVIIDVAGGISDNEVLILEANGWTIKKPRS
ncbi:MAG: hypothetical protein KGZ30_00490 [Anaplasmataceae bacterium]|nr:hypothetical protein [Anaplasmataceae bacterium]